MRSGDREHSRDMAGRALPAPVLLAVAARPWLWWVAARQVARLAEPGWWRRFPPVPRPAPGYLAFRLETATGRAARDARPAEVVAYLEWCRGRRRPRGRV